MGTLPWSLQQLTGEVAGPGSQSEGDTEDPPEDVVGVRLRPRMGRNRRLGSSESQGRTPSSVAVAALFDGQQVYGESQAQRLDLRRMEPSKTSTVEGAVPRIRYSSVSRAGHTGDANVRKRNQDAHIVIPQYNGVADNYMFGVFDGHGQFGTEASQFASSSFALSFSLAGIGDPGGSPVKKAPAAPPSPGKTQRRGTLMMMNDMKHTMKETHKALLQERSFDVSLSGTTAVVAFIDANRLFVANAGDSKAVLATQANGRLVAKDLNVEHKANTSGEGKRIAASGGKVKEDQSYEGAPARVFLQEPLFYKGQYFEIPGLAMSRSLGDKVAHSVGVSSEAEVLKKIIDKDDRFIVVASDGLWEFVTSAEAVNIVAQSLDSPSGWGDLDVAAAKLLAEAELRWAQEDEVCDDITIIVIGIDFEED